MPVLEPNEPNNSEAASLCPNEPGKGGPLLLNCGRILWYWTPVLLWMWLIYSASSDQNSAQNSSRIIGPIIRFFHPAITPAGMAKALFLARKVAHLTVYAVLSYLLWLAFMGTMKRNLSRWNWRPVIYSFALIALYAISDEIHQRFVPSRTGTPWDVLIDCTGGAVALCAIWVVGRWRRRW